ncbi:unnamed protein product [Oncorhynchus mykiss]|uniref:Uncharacterized protein n=1 Tax=Oncorhynchus mykiss TaxID=8022 RepID=A0A060XUC5_ONCMY|nr:unnamed protein product [Oncorhynchus mykiss]
MGDVISTHLDEGKREMITARARQVMGEFGHVYKEQYAVALFNGVRFEIEGGGGPQSQLLHRKASGQAGLGTTVCCSRSPSVLPGFFFVHPPPPHSSSPFYSVPLSLYSHTICNSLLLYLLTPLFISSSPSSECKAVCF